MTGLFRFEWQRCLDGYEAADFGEPSPGRNPRAPYRIFIRPRSGRIEVFHPLDIQRALFRQFAATETSVAAMLGFAESFGLLTHPSDEEPIGLWRASIESMRTLVAKWTSGRMDEVAEAYNRLNFGNLALRLAHDRRTPWPHLEIVPTKLLDAMWAQFAQAVSKNERHKACLRCGAWFAYGPGTGKRNTAIYCSAKCQKAHQYAKKKVADH
ncbi:MAG: hypothetical protein V3R55_05555 [Alphaproteobacteria bacterium]